MKNTFMLESIFPIYNLLNINNLRENLAKFSVFYSQIIRTNDQKSQIRFFGNIKNTLSKFIVFHI